MPMCLMFAYPGIFDINPATVEDFLMAASGMNSLFVNRDHTAVPNRSSASERSSRRYPSLLGSLIVK
jgi:hypothetical protein